MAGSSTPQTTGMPQAETPTVRGAHGVPRSAGSPPAYTAEPEPAPEYSNTHAPANGNRADTGSNDRALPDSQPADVATEIPGPLVQPTAPSYGDAATANELPRKKGGRWVLPAFLTLSVVCGVAICVLWFTLNDLGLQIGLTFGVMGIYVFLLLIICGIRVSQKRRHAALRRENV